ncbi:glycosyltransferase [Paenibacillus paeoniae]|uniref:Glycosyltransferase n=1 Tax=Paenibacillus paeoniae TaxID=2292705 RepID=A0A371P1U9_9BACL|nr:glycosyltransferase [Paenibacillus paeoniae]REK69578.1 glycosyltransferase [Paenibacillus paeoniae]
MKRLSQNECASSENDEQLLVLIQNMTGHWDRYAFADILQAYQEFDYLLKRSFLTLVNKMPSAQAYSMLHEIWVSVTKDIHHFFDEHHLFPGANDSVRLKDLIELSFFQAKELLVKGTEPVSITPVVSVILPVHRAQQYLWEALRSLYEQTYQDFELIIVNGYQNDDPLDCILSIFNDKRTIVVQETAKIRLGASLNIGIKQARGEFIARMDSDDIAHPERFMKQIEFFLMNPDIDFCGTQYRAFGTTNNWNYSPFPLEHKELQCRSLKYCNFLHPTVMWRKAKFMKNSLWYNEDVLAEDTELFARVAFSLKTANLAEALLLYRREGTNLSITNLKEKNQNNQSLAVVQSIQLEQKNLAALYQTLDEEELHLLQGKEKDSFTYGDALKIFRRRLGRDDLSSLLPPDTNEAAVVFQVNVKGRTPVIWGYGWNGQLLEHTLQNQEFDTYRIVDQRMQELGIRLDAPQAMSIDELDGQSDLYYILVSMDRHFPEVTSRLQRYGYTLQKDFVEYFL